MAETMTFGIAVVGCGAIGRRRAAAAPADGVVACADVRRQRAEELARTIGGDVFVSDDWRAVVERPDVNVVIVATTNDSLAPVARAALGAGKHVLVEKPAARTVAELDAVIDAAKGGRSTVHVGFNLRYHAALQRARVLVDDGAIGDLLFVRGRYGHGGRPGYHQEWRADPMIAGGGELLDQGVHLIDLARWFLGEFTAVEGFAHTYFWPMPVDDNAFLTLRTAQARTAFLHVSCTEWRNLFSLEIYGRGGKLHAEGLGGSYGLERLTLYRMLPEMGPPETTIWEYPRGDRSWETELGEFFDDIREGRRGAPALEDARAALVVVEDVYRKSGYDFHSAAAGTAR